MTTLEITYQRPNLYPKQERAIFGPSRYSVVEGATKSGKTVACIAWILEQALHGKAGQNFWWVAPVYSQTKVAFRRLKRGLPQHLYITNESELTVTLLNGSIVRFLSAEKPDALYGEDVYGVVLDEATRMRQESWFAIRSTITATRGKVRIIGNVKGRNNWAYRLARKAEQGEPEWDYAKLTAYDAVDAGILDRREIEQAKAQLPEQIFNELYKAVPSEDGGNPFGQGAIFKCIGPMGLSEPAVFGVDLAKSVDWTVAVGLDVDGSVCSFDRFQLPWEETIVRLARLIGDTHSIVDSTGVGDPVVERLQRHLPSVEGFHFSSTSKQKLMEGLALAIQGQHVTLPEGPLVSELSSFAYEYTRTGVRYSAPDGLHDDCVMALALAVHGQGITPSQGLW